MRMMPSQALQRRWSRARERAETGRSLPSLTTSRAQSGAGRARALRQGRLYRRRRGRRSGRPCTRTAAQRPGRRPHGANGHRQGVDGAVVSHRYDGAGGIVAAGRAAERYPRTAECRHHRRGMMIRAKGALVGAIGVSGAPGGDADASAPRRARRSATTWNWNDRLTRADAVATLVGRSGHPHTRDRRFPA